jgi:hypothetical protein
MVATVLNAHCALMGNKTHAWAGKVIVTVFGMQMMLIISTSLKLGPPSIKECYIATLKTFKTTIKKSSEAREEHFAAR